MLGLTVLIPLGYLTPSLPVILLLAFVCVVLVVAIVEPYWLQVTFVTILVVLVAAPVRGAAVVAERRALFTPVGAALVLAVGALADRVARHRLGPGHPDGGDADW